MRDTKSLSLLLLSSVLFLLSIILLCTWGYQYYHQIQDDKSKTVQTATVATNNNTSTVNDATRDSLLKIYQQTLKSLDNKADTTFNIADSLNVDLNANLKEFYRLRDEIGVLLRTQTPNAENLSLARNKISELQKNVELLRFKNLDVQKENKRLKAVIEQLNRVNSAQSTRNLNNTAQTYIEESNGEKKIKAPQGTISALKLNLFAAASTQDNSDEIVGSFTVKNNTGVKAWCDLMVVVTQPDGKVIQKSAWESGSFETNNGKKIYSCKIRCEAGKGESKQINFALNPDNYQKGTYSMQVYHNGVLIGRVSKILS